MMGPQLPEASRPILLGFSFGTGITRLLEGAVILGGPSKLPQATNQIRTMKLYQALGGLGVLGYSLGYPTHNKV